MSKVWLIAVVSFAVGGMVSAGMAAHADPAHAFDRALIERLVRAEEQQARTLDQLARTAAQCKR